MVAKRAKDEGGEILTPKKPAVDPYVLKPLKRIKKRAQIVCEHPLSIRRRELTETQSSPANSAKVAPTSPDEQNLKVADLDSSFLAPLKRRRKSAPIVRGHPLSIRRERLQPARSKKRQKGGQKKIFEYLKEEEKEEETKIFRCCCGKGTAENPGGLIIQCNICKTWLHKRCTHRGYGSTRKKKRVFVCLQCHFSPPDLWGEKEEEPQEETDETATPKKKVRFRENSERLLFCQKNSCNSLMSDQVPHDLPT